MGLGEEIDIIEIKIIEIKSVCTLCGALTAQMDCVSSVTKMLIAVTAEDIRPDVLSGGVPG